MTNQAAFILLLVCTAFHNTCGQGTAFTYQGRLHDNGVPANGTYDLQFTVYNSAGGATVIAGPVTGPGVPVTNGLFTVSLDFGTSVFTGPARWLQIGVRTNGGAAFVPLNPRQALTPTPYAIFAATASNVVNGAVVKSVNTLKDDVTLAAGANVTITPDGNTLTIASTAGVGGETNSLWSRNGADAYYNAGNVGIGTATPATKLEIQGTLGGALRLNPDLLGIGSNGDGYELNLAGGVPDGSSAGGQIRLGGSARGDGDLNVIQFKQNDAEVMRINNAGNVGIGTTSPLSKLHLFDPVDSVTHLLQSGGGVNAWTKVAFNNPNGQWDIGTSRSFNNDAFYIDRLSQGSLEFQLSTTGLLGLGIEPQSKLHLYEPDNSVSQRIQTGGGVNAWTRLELINANGQWDIGTSRGFNGDQLYFSRPGTGIALGLQPNGDAFLAGNVNVGGNAVQPRDKGGWVKAMAKVNADGTIARQYSALGGTITASYAVNVVYFVTFPFRVDDRFISVTPFHNNSVGGVTGVVNLGCPGCGPNEVVVTIHQLDDPSTPGDPLPTNVANEFFIFVY